MRIGAPRGRARTGRVAEASWGFSRPRGRGLGGAAGENHPGQRGSPKGSPKRDRQPGVGEGRGWGEKICARGVKRRAGGTHT